LNFVKTNR